MKITRQADNSSICWSMEHLLISTRLDSPEAIPGTHKRPPAPVLVSGPGSGRLRAPNPAGLHFLKAIIHKDIHGVVHLDIANAPFEKCRTVENTRWS